MTQDLKEMLHCIEMNCKHNKCFGGIKLDEKDCKLLLDYITNLQQENKVKTHQIEVLEEIVNYERNIRNDKLQQEKDCLQRNYNDNEQAIQKLIKELKELQQENETLKEQNNDLRKIYRNTYKRLFKNGNNELARYFQAQIDDCPTFYVEPIIDYVKEYKIYKSRCQKAIEYIENNKKETSSHFNGKEYVYRNFTLCCEPNDLLIILNGSDEK